MHQVRGLIDELQVESFEKEHKITLPPAYRGFILQVRWCCCCCALVSTALVRGWFGSDLLVLSRVCLSQVANGGCGPPRTGLAKLGEAVKMHMCE